VDRDVNNALVMPDSTIEPRRRRFRVFCVFQRKKKRAFASFSSSRAHFPLPRFPLIAKIFDVAPPIHADAGLNAFPQTADLF
jgi:hypothetical protein